MEHADVSPVTSINADDNTPILFEVSPNANQETIVEIDVTNTAEKPSILYPSGELDSVRKSFNIFYYY